MRRTFYRISFSMWVVVALFFLMCPQSQAMLYNQDGLQLTGKLEAKAAFFTNNATGYTQPDYKAWDMFKQRNMGYLQLNHDLTNLTGLDLQYMIVLRAMYDGVYDYGPKVFREAYDQNKSEFERYNIKYQGGIWEAYFNYSRGPLNLRVGRQNLSWGNADVMRVVDHINPLDNTWGGTGTESLDDRRIPLWMVRAGYSVTSNIMVEGFLVPGAIDNTTAPITPKGSPYGLPLFDQTSNIGNLLGVRVQPNDSWRAATDPPRDMSSSRVGMKLLIANALGGDNSNLEFSYQRTYWDNPAARYKTGPAAVIPGSGDMFSVEAVYPKVNVFGVSGAYVFQDLDFIVKGDIAHVPGVPVTINSYNYPISAYYVITTGEFTYRDFTNYVISLEKSLNVPFINATEKLKFLFEYYGFYCHNYDRNITINVPDPDNFGGSPRNITMKRLEQIAALSVSSEWHLKTKVSLAALYNPSGSWLISPSLSYRFDNPFTIGLGYSLNFGKWVVPFAQDLDRDQVNVTLKYEF